MIRLAVALFLALPAAGAQSVFHAELTGDQSNTPSTATGTGVVYYDQASQTFSYVIEVSGLSSPVLAAHVHKGPADGAGDPWLDLTGGPDVWIGTSPVLTAEEVGQLLGSNMYIVFHNATYPTGEIRGQITPALDQLDALLDGSKVVPPTGSTGTATASFTLNPDNSLTYLVTTSGLQGTPQAVRIYYGLPGVNGTQVFALPGGPTTWSGTLPPLTGKQRAFLRSGLYYVKVLTSTFPSGEVRGQIAPSFTPYGEGCAGPAGVPALSGSGVPTPGGVPTLSISGGTAGGTGLLLLAFSATEVPVAGDCTLYVGPTVPILVPLGLGPGGSLDLPAALDPTTPAPVWLQLQFFEVNAAAPNGKYFGTNGLSMHIND